MGNLTVANQSLTYNHYLDDNPAVTASSLKYKVFAVNLLEKISWVAILALSALVLTISYSGIVLTGALPYVMAGVGITTIISAWAVTKLRVWSNTCNYQLTVETKVAEQLKQIEQWRTPEITQFLQEQQIDIQQIPLPILEHKNRQEPLCALLPLIARFKFLKSEFEKIERVSQDNLTFQIERNLEQRDIELRRESKKSLTETQKREMRTLNRRLTWIQRELNAFPLSLDAAVLLEIMQHPDQEFKLADLGDYRCKSFEERVFDRTYEPRNDHYFVFETALNRPPLTFTEIEENHEPRALRFKLFPNEIRA